MYFRFSCFLSLFKFFRWRLLERPDVFIATKAPYLSQQMFYNTGHKVPYIRPVSSYLGVKYNPKTLDIISNRRPGFTWDIVCVINSFIETCDSCTWKVWYPEELGGGGKGISWQKWTEHRAAIMIPYGWLQTITFYEFIAMGMPTLVPDPDMFTMYFFNTPQTQIAFTWLF